MISGILPSTERAFVLFSTERGFWGADDARREALWCDPGAFRASKEEEIDMNDNVTILGRVGADPKRSETTNGVAVVNFRVASPQRRFDPKTQAWIETGAYGQTTQAAL